MKNIWVKIFSINKRIIALTILYYLTVNSFTFIAAQSTADSLIKLHPELFNNPIDTYKKKSKIETLKPDSIQKNYSEFTKFTDYLDSLKIARTFGFIMLTGSQADLLKLSEELPFFSYDFVDGLYFGFPTQNLSKLIRKNWGINLGFGYGFGSHYWQGKIGYSKLFFANTEPLTFAVEVHNISDTRDSWKIGQTENSANTFLLGIDSRDYFQRTGGSVKLIKDIKKGSVISLAYLIDKYTYLLQSAFWSLFTGNKNTGNNNIFEKQKLYVGNISSLSIGFIYEKLELGTNTWLSGKYGFEAELEILLNQLQSSTAVSDKRFAVLNIAGLYKKEVIENILSFALNARYYQGFGYLPAQRYFTLGGLGSLNGFNKNEFLGSAGFLIESDIFTHLIWNTNFILSNDIGFVNNQNPVSVLFTGFPDSINKIKYSVGFGIGYREGVNLGLHFRTDKQEKPKFIFRFSNRF